MKILHFTTHNEDCGIAKYQEQFIAAMHTVGGVEHTVFEYSPNVTKHMSEAEFTPVLKQLVAQMRDQDILHIQHEISFFKKNELYRVVKAVRRMRKKVMMTVHTAPDAMYKEPKLEGYGPRSWLKYLRAMKAAREFTDVHIRPMREVDLVIVHNTVTKKNLMKHGVKEDRIRIIDMPVPNISFERTSTVIKKALDYRSGDVLFCAVGFVSKTKGFDHAVKALNFLPKNYKLAIIGGMHPEGRNDKYLDKLCDIIAEYGLQDRVYITGFLADDEELNAAIRECDICVYPYDREYYSYVSSASLSNALANHKPTVAYPTASFREVNSEMDVLALTKSFNYYELAREIRAIDVPSRHEKSKQYAQLHAYDKEGEKFIDIYQQLIA